MPGFRNRYYPYRCPKCSRGLYAAPKDPIPFTDSRGRTIGFEVQCLNCQETLRYIHDEGF